MSKPMYQKIYDQILKNIETGFYQPGAKLPSEKELSENYAVSRITSKKALEMLAEKGYIIRQPGKGSFVRHPGDSRKRMVSATSKAGTQKKIGVVLEYFDCVFGLKIFETIENLAEKNHFFIIPRLAYGLKEAEEKAIEELLELGVDGVVLMTSHSEDINLGILKLVMDQVPLVLVDRFLKGIPAPFVGTDNVGATLKATDYLLDLGHRNISFLTRPYLGTLTIEDRVSGFVRSHAEHGTAIDESKWITDIESLQPGCRTREYIDRDIGKIRDLVAQNPQITCLFAAEYNIAEMARYAVEGLGLRVPEDISILCFDGPADVWGNSFFTQILQREKEIGEKVVQLLLDQLDHGAPGRVQKIFYDADLVIGKSTCPPGKR